MLVIFPVCDRTALLPFFLRYYSSIGATKFICGLYGGKDNPVYQDILQFKSDYDIEIKSTFTSDRDHWNSAAEAKGLNRIRENLPEKVKWYCIADLDEFHFFGGKNLQDIAQEAEQGGYEAVHGIFYDRIAVDGSFPELSDTLDETFPLCCNLTQSTKCAFDKIVMARRHVKINAGHHNVDAKTRRGIAQVHHFKWYKGVYEVLEGNYWRYKRQGLRTADGWPRILKLIEGGIDIFNPTLSVRIAPKIGV